IRITGDDDCDNVRVAIREKEYHVTIRGAFALPIDRIVVHGLGGDDDIEVAGDVDIPAWLYGEAGDDRLKGGAGDDVPSAGDRPDQHHGSGGRHLPLGGPASDRLNGNGDNDILVAGTTDFDANVLALNAVMAEWTRGDADYGQRVSHLRQGGGLNGTVL